MDIPTFPPLSQKIFSDNCDKEKNLNPPPRVGA